MPRPEEAASARGRGAASGGLAPLGDIPAAEAREAGKETPSGSSDSPLPAPARSVPALKSGKEAARQGDDNQHLTLAAVYLDQGKEDLACHHLERHLERHPDQHNARFYYAELLLRLERRGDAREQFGKVIADLQEEYFLDLRHIVHCHGRLAEIGEAADDEFERQLHRGIALYWLAQMPAASPEEESLPAEGILCKAAAALIQAHHLDPDEARPCWYLHSVWRKLGQDQPARRYLSTAQARSSFSLLTPAEHRGMLLVQK